MDIEQSIENHPREKVTRLEIVKQYVSNLQNRFDNLINSSMIAMMSDPETRKQLQNNTKRQQALLDHPRNSKIRFVQASLDKHSHFSVSFTGESSKKYKGITSVLNDVFFNNDSEATHAQPKQKRNNEYIGSSNYDVPKEKVLRSIQKDPRGACMCKSKGIGNTHGTIVHTELDRMVKCYTMDKYNKNMMNFFGSVCDEVDAPHMPDFCVIRILDKLVTLGFVPIASEFPIFDEQSGIATQIDLICIDAKTFEICVFELKSGGTNPDDFISPTTKKMMRGALADCPDTPYNRAAIQLIISCIILQQRYDIFVDRGYVMHVCGPAKAANLYPLPTWLRGGTTIRSSGKPRTTSPESADANRLAIYFQVCTFMKTREIQREEQREARKSAKKSASRKKMRNAWKTQPHQNVF